VALPSKSSDHSSSDPDNIVTDPTTTITTVLMEKLGRPQRAKLPATGHRTARWHTVNITKAACSPVSECRRHTLCNGIKTDRLLAGGYTEGRLGCIGTVGMSL
ncbi:hypothetical protein BaRGS_00038085, partial [Batillaria attramentaria]